MGSLLTKEEIKRILQSRFKHDECTRLNEIPKPSSLKDIHKASKRIVRAIREHERIAIVGDYDVDGVISSVILSQFFDDVGVDYTLIIPNRFTDGYGLNPEIVAKLDVQVIITVDNGISAVEAARICKEQGIDLIITDHHNVPEVLPEAYAIVNPKQEDCSFPHCEICGAQVAWYLVAALKEEMGIEYDLSSFLDLLCIAIMADMMELLGMNRVMVKKGILELNRSKRPAFEAIRQYYGKRTFESDDISFLIAPLINSSGRMEDAMFSYAFIKASNVEEALKRLDYIVSLNEARKEEERLLFEATLPYVNENENIIVVWGEEWHEGIVGIVASRLSKRFKKPAIVFSIKDEKAKGSARGVGGVNILELIRAQEKFLIGYGGHKGAAGVSIEVHHLPHFKEKLVEAARILSQEELEADNDLLGEISADQIDFELLEILEQQEPYGQKNPKPSFLLRNISVKVDRFIGKEGQHLKLILQEGTNALEALFFNYDVKARQGDKIDILFTLSRNDYRGLVTPQLMIKQIIKKH
ncbi:single-stranded-DNA-specific exonuclease RecJ [Sulfurospirillum barnesii]|uniref:Single-stranded-DNA-specific exonuclease RecJ n=1 Tax=Sulfurospirillum barnesii (strain ATCC 700032 / DSM 10660 / SES-3) TaxID=760154 RepID=I3XTW9_SULBS|nr:single-stranded-DNA-specific exonuclease RecJ [Sulfurospirillum barnesii]AFL67393.1 exonuclease RecJ [Sulfurospirillum barnesii SES-3]